MALVNDEPPQLGSLYREDEMWDAYDGEDQDLRRARWLAITAGWVLGQDDMVAKLLAPLTPAELIDLDASLTGLRHEVRHVIAKTSAPWTKNTRPELGPDPA